MNPLEIRTYEQFINTTADQSFQNLLSEIRYWVTTRLDLADAMYNTITKED